MNRGKMMRKSVRTIRKPRMGIGIYATARRAKQSTGVEEESTDVEMDDNAEGMVDMEDTEKATRDDVLKVSVLDVPIVRCTHCSEDVPTDLLNVHPCTATKKATGRPNKAGAGYIARKKPKIGLH